VGRGAFTYYLPDIAIKKSVKDPTDWGSEPNSHRVPVVLPEHELTGSIK